MSVPTPTLAQPDPAGARLAVLRPALEQLRYIEGFFFESGASDRTRGPTASDRRMRLMSCVRLLWQLRQLVPDAQDRRAESRLCASREDSKPPAKEEAG